MDAFAILLICLVGIGVGSAIRDATFRICKNRRLESNLVSYTKVRSFLDCAAKCTKDDSSNSANFMKSSKTCELYNNVLTQTQCDQLRANDSTTVIIKSNPCKNNQPFDGTSCICSPPLSGVYCEQGGLKDCYGIGQQKYIDIYPDDGMGKIQVFCRNQRMIAFAAPPNGFTLEYHNKTWQEYKYGFGDVNQANAEAIGAYWLGNENIHRITKGTRSYDFKYWFEHPDNPAYNHHYYFAVESEAENYTIRYSTANGETGRQILNGASFGTIDRNGRTCASTYGVGYWFNNDCSRTPPLFGTYMTSGNIEYYAPFWAFLMRM